MPDWIIYLSGLALAVLVTVLALRSHHARRWRHPWRLRRPLRKQPLIIDGSLLLAPRRMTECRLPLQPESQPRLRSGALLWASAATVTHTLAAECDQAAILEAVKPLGFSPEKFLARCPILAETAVGGQRGYIVRDGHGRRAYFLGEPQALMDRCALVWDQQERPKTPQDAAAGSYGLAMAPVDATGPGPLTYLGSLRIETPLRDLTQIRALLAQFPGSCVTPAASAPEHTPALQALSAAQPPADGLHVVSAPCESSCFVVDDPDSPWPEELLQGYALAGRQRRALTSALLAVGTLALAALIWQASGLYLPLAALLLLPRAMEERPRRRSSAAAAIAFVLWLILFPLGLRLFMNAAVPLAAAPALPLALWAMAGVLGLPRSGFGIALTSAGTILALGLTWFILQPPLLAALFCLVAGALYALVLRSFTVLR